MEDKKVLSTIEQVKAISDPYKLRILKIFSDIDSPATVKQVADLLNETPAKIHYHVKKMEKLEILKLIYTKEINGILAKYYEPTAKSFDIRCDDNSDDTSKSAMLGETQRGISKLYNNSKNTFLNELAFVAKNNKETEGYLNMLDLSLTEEEAKEFIKCIEEFLKKCKIKNNVETNKNKYHFFISFLKLNLEDNNKPSIKAKCKLE